MINLLVLDQNTLTVESFNVLSAAAPPQEPTTPPNPPTYTRGKDCTTPYFCPIPTEPTR